ncbi:MAG TPA: MT-A70 family methyltransferase [Thermomicrobiales bacterium]|nr:MT-A70 family methyltransferase [Thermomicrobiales bacterium]
MALRSEPLREIVPPPDLPSIVGGFKTVLADPPWRFTNRTGKVAPEHRRLDRYSTLTVDEICALPLAGRVAKDAHLYLWVPNALLPDGLRVMQAWGFRYVSNIVWAKRRKDGGPDGRGVGFYFRNVTEILLFGVRGSMRTLQPGRRQVNMIETRKREHSRKPDEQYQIIESCSPGPYLELFARHPRRHWTVWGDEANEETVPRGRVHKGYEGGPIYVPQLPLYGRLEESQTEYVAEELRRRYDDGRSIRDLSVETGYSIGRIRGLLSHAGTPIRPRGNRPGDNECIDQDEVWDVRIAETT